MTGSSDKGPTKDGEFLYQLIRDEPDVSVPII
jgi:hypothetical protein